MKSSFFGSLGTGNSLSSSNDIAKGLENTKIISINTLLLNTIPINLSEYTHIGFVFILHSHHIPSVFSRFVEGLKFNPDQYIFALASYTDIFGRAMEQLRNYISVKGGILFVL